MNDKGCREVTLFTEALQTPAADRGAFLSRACTSDDALRRKVERLLADHERVGDFLEYSPAQPVDEERPKPVVGEKPGDRIGHYKLLQQIGEGGCGIVYMAQQDEPARRRVALKIIKPGMDTKSVIARFEAERQALALMDHPNIAKVFDAGASGSGRPYFVMELIRGIKITEYCDRNSLTTRQRLELFVQVCHAIQHAHQKGVIHRDIKPSNILVTVNLEGAPAPVVIDFGIAKATTNQQLTDKTLFTAFEMLIGTPAYMSPEQAVLTSVDVDTRSDIYSLGILLYELLTGAPPFDSKEMLKAGLDEVRRVIREQEPPRPSTRLGKMKEPELTTVAQHRGAAPPALIRSVRGDLDWIVMKALEKDRTRRYETADGLARDVQRFLADETVAARPPSVVYKFQKLAQRNKLLFIGVGLIALLIVASLIVVSKSLAQERQAHLETALALRQAEAEKKAAQTETAKSRQVTTFLEDMLQGVGPSVARGRDTTMLREILGRTSERIGTELTNQPAVEAELRSLLGQLYFEIGNLDEAEKMQRAALEIDRRLYGPNCAEVASSLNELGLVLYKERNLDEAERAHGEALEIRRHLFGNENTDVAASLNNLASVYRRQQKLPEAEALIREALAIRQKKFGKESLEVADSLHNLAVILGDEGRRADSEATAKALVAIRRKILGNEDVSVAAGLSDLAWAAESNGNLNDAETFEGESLAIRRKLLGDEHPDVTSSFAKLADLMRQRGNRTEAHAVLNAVLSVQLKLLGEDDPATLATLGTLAELLGEEGKWAEAEALHLQSVALWRRRAGTEYSETVGQTAGLVRDLVAQKKFDEAERLLAEGLTPALLNQPACVNLVEQRLTLMGRQGRWTEAAASAALAVRFRPTEHYFYHELAGLLAMMHNRPAYEELCGRILSRFADTQQPYIAERAAGDCLLLPNSGADLSIVDKLADISTKNGSNESALPFFQACKALSCYRRGIYPEAIEWAQKALRGSLPDAQAKACAVLALANWQLGQKDAARAMLAWGNSLVPIISAGHGGGDLGESWVGWLFARVSLDEADTLIGPGTSPDTK